MHCKKILPLSPVIFFTQQINKLIYPISLDVEKAFDKVSHTAIKQSLAAFCLLQIAVQAITNLALVGFAQVEVNKQKSLVFKIEVGSGQGDPFSSPIFLIATEPLNLALVKLFSHIRYTTRQGIPTDPSIYADDNLTCYQLQRAADLTPVQGVYAEYTAVSGLQINVTKSTALCINTSEEIINGLRDIGFATPDTVPYLEIQLGKTIQETINATLGKINPKAIRRGILAPTPPTDLLHRACLITQAVQPIYNHVFMAIPILSAQTDVLFEELLSFLWTRQKEGQTVQKRQLVAKN